jgi:hypothetical protein
MKTEKELLEEILVAQVLLMSRSMDEEKKAKGTHRVFGDYTRDAVNEIKQNKTKILDLFKS